MASEAKYKVMQKYMIREPYFKANEDVEKSNIFREAILIASKSLYNDMKKYEDGKIRDNKKKEDIRMSLLKYSLRMCTRATPFGIFAMPTIGNINVKIENQERKIIKSIRPDYEWLMKVIKDIEKRHYTKLIYCKNDIAYEKGEYIIIPYITGKECKEQLIYMTESIKKIIEICKKNTYSYSDLYINITSNFENYSKKKYEEEMNLLIENEILISNLRPPISEKNILQYVIEQISKNKIEDESCKSLKTIEEKFKQYEISKNGEKILLDIYELMDKIEKSDNLVEVNLVNVNEKNLISKEEISEIEEFTNLFINILLRMKRSYSIYEEYKDLFYEKYGEYNEVPICQMLDESLGIGIPQSYSQAKVKYRGYKTYTNEIHEEFKKYFWNKYEKACKYGKAIVLNDIKEFIKKENTDNGNKIFPDSIDLNFRIVNRNEKKEFICSSDFGCIGAGRTMGRFSYMSDEFYKICKEYAEIDKDNEDTIFCDLLYIPARTRMTNVITNKQMHKFEISFYTYDESNTENRIFLDDIYVGINNGRFYLKSKTLNKKIKIRTNNLLHFQKDCPLVRFLKEIDIDGVVRWENIFEKLEDFMHFPEIRYKSIIIRPEQWIFEYNEIYSSFDNFDEWFYETKKKENITDKVFMVYGDNKLLIDLNNRTMRKMLYTEIKKRKRVTLEKSEDMSDEHVTEVVLSLKNENKKDLYKQEKYEINSMKESLKLIGSDWLYIKFFGVANEDRFIYKTIGNEMDKLIKENIIDKYYYIRYADPYRQIRLRMNGKKIFNNIQKIVRFCNEQVKLNRITKYEICPYEREINRYGGIIATEIAEKIFFRDTEFINEILKLENKNNYKYKREIFSIISNIYFMKDFGMETEQQVEWLDKRIDKETYRYEYNKEKIGIEKDIFEFLKDRKNEDLKKLIVGRGKVVKEYKNIFNNKKASVDVILESLLHMSFNRLFGMDRILEKKLLTYTRHFLYNINNKMKYVKQEDIWKKL